MKRMSHISKRIKRRLSFLNGFLEQIGDELFGLYNNTFGSVDVFYNFCGVGLL